LKQVGNGKRAAGIFFDLASNYAMMHLRRTSLLLALWLCCAGAACTRNPASAETDTLSKAVPGATPPSTGAYALNVPALVGLNIDEVRRQLGQPQEGHHQAMGAEPQNADPQGEDWVNTFERQGITVVVTFNTRTRKVRDLVLPGSKEEELMRRGNLSFVSEDYLVLPVIDKAEPSLLQGVRVIQRRK
jgi:hypothetical protein